MQKCTYIMSKAARRRRYLRVLCIVAVAFSARAQTDADHLVTRVIAEVLASPATVGAEPGAAARLEPAERVVPGDVLIYTVEVRNTGPSAVDSAVIVQPIPNHTTYLPDSAVGPGVDVDYSVDGGRTFDSAQKLKSPGAYTHIRWHLHNRLKPNSIAFVRFRAQVN